MVNDLRLHHPSELSQRPPPLSASSPGQYPLPLSRGPPWPAKYPCQLSTLANFDPNRHGRGSDSYTAEVGRARWRRPKANATSGRTPQESHRRNKAGHDQWVLPTKTPTGVFRGSPIGHYSVLRTSPCSGSSARHSTRSRVWQFGGDGSLTTGHAVLLLPREVPRFPSSVVTTRI